MVLESANSIESKTNNQNSGLIERFWNLVLEFLTKHDSKVKYLTQILIAIVYNSFFVAATYHHWTNRLEIDWCGGVGLLIVLTVITYASLFYYKIFKPKFGKRISSNVLAPLSKLLDKYWNIWFVRGLLIFGGLAAFIAWLVIDTTGDRDRLYSLLGLAAFLLFGWIFSKNPSHIQWTPVIMGVILQFVFGIIVLRWDAGKNVFACLGDRVSIFLNYADVGSEFVYGHLVTDQNLAGISLKAIFAFKVLSTMFLFSFMISILYYYGIMQSLIAQIGWFLQVTIGTTAVESVNCASNIFLGQTESPLAIKPFLHLLTKSELHTVMTSGFSTISGSVLSAYISFGINASHLLSASIMSAPAALAFAKLFYPETEESQTNSQDIQVPKGTESNVLDAAARGASNAIQMVLEIIASLIAFLAFIAFLNGIITWTFSLIGAPYISFEFLVGKLFIPIAWIMGVPQNECDLIGHVVGLKTVVNEFAAYKQLSEYMKQGLISKRSETIATYALCGFSNPGSIGIQIATLGSMAPLRRGDLAQVAMRAFISGSVASFMTACVAGTLTPSSF